MILLWYQLRITDRAEPLPVCSIVKVPSWFHWIETARDVSQHETGLLFRKSARVNASCKEALWHEPTLLDGQTRGASKVEIAHS
jgi:hypothetical protein